MIPKFRVFECVTNIMWQSHEIDVCFRQDELYIDIPRGKNRAIYFGKSLNRITLMQSTGLLDKNGVEIFEGDIVAFEDSDGGYEYPDLAVNTGIVEYGDLGFYFTNRVAVDMADFYIEDGRCDEVEVIGNIYENPELLEVEE